MLHVSSEGELLRKKQQPDKRQIEMSVSCPAVLRLWRLK